MCMRVQDHLMQAHFIQIHQVFTRKNWVGYFSNRVVDSVTVHECIVMSLTCTIAITKGWFALSEETCEVTSFKRIYQSRLPNTRVSK